MMPVSFLLGSQRTASGAFKECHVKFEIFSRFKNSCIPGKKQTEGDGN